MAGFFAQSVLLALWLQPIGRGDLAVIVLLPSLFVTFSELGLRQTASNFIGKKTAAIDDVASTLMYLWTITAGVSVAVVLLGFKVQGITQYGWPLLFLALAPLPLNLLVSYGRGVALGLQKISLINGVDLLQGLGGLLYVALFVGVYKLWLMGALLALLCTSLSASLLVLVYLRRAAVVRWRKVPGLPLQMLKKGFLYALTLFLFGLNYRFDIYILQQLVDSAEIGRYTVGVSIAETLWYFQQSSGIIVFSYSCGASDAEMFSARIAKIVRTLLPFGILLGLMIALLSPWAVPLIFGRSYAGSVHVIWAILPGVTALFVSKLLYSDLAGTGVPRAVLCVLVIMFGINVVGNLLLIPRLGVIGAGLASSLSYGLGSALFVYVYSTLRNIPVRDILLPKRQDYAEVMRHLKERLNRRACRE